MRSTESPTANGMRAAFETSKRVRWDIDEDVIRGRRFDAAHKFLPDGLSLADGFTTLSANEKRFVSQIQGRTYANVFGLVERFINAKVLELTHDHWFGDQVALEALVRFSDEELKHQALFRRIDDDGRRRSARWLSLRYRPQRRRPRCARQEYMGGVGADARYRVVHSTPLSPAASIPTPNSPSCSRTCSSTTGRRKCQHAILDELASGCDTTPG